MTESETAIPNFAESGGLLPAIVQDELGEVLMLAWMNAESFAETCGTGQACFYSRSRQRLWRKGELSGNRQHVLEIRIDCDADTILLRVRQEGPACHEGFRSCFFRSLHEGQWTQQQVRMRDPSEMYAVDMAPKSKTDG